ncbi:hypothetical protein NDU88_003846 [Pleurodeles waltl]|uniref:Uncharacterized protein n=1 Tax=Pleurodeles waltl TaxID=8319 RepID=A0AAV7LGL6_PLEWA|nr:hypothetical protein NDU88_003846 [Pleurodeles waltl]
MKRRQPLCAVRPQRQRQRLQLYAVVLKAVSHYDGRGGKVSGSGRVRRLVPVGVVCRPLCYADTMLLSMDAPSSRQFQARKIKCICQGSYLMHS